MCLVHCVVRTFLRLFFSLKPSKLVRRPLLWGWTCAAAPVIFTAPAPGGAGLNRCGQHARGTQRSQPRCLFGCSCLMEAEGQLGTVPVTCDTPEEGADGPLHSHIVAHRGYLWAAPRGAPAESKELPHSSPLLRHVGNSESRVTARSVCISLQNSSIWC